MLYVWKSILVATTVDSAHIYSTTPSLQNSQASSKLLSHCPLLQWLGSPRALRLPLLCHQHSAGTQGNDVEAPPTQHALVPQIKGRWRGHEAWGTTRTYTPTGKVQLQNSTTDQAHMYPNPSLRSPPQPFLVLRDTLCSSEAVLEKIPRLRGNTAQSSSTHCL